MAERTKSLKKVPKKRGLFKFFSNEYDYAKDPETTDLHKDICAFLDRKYIDYLPWMSGNDFYLISYDAYIVIEKNIIKERWRGKSKMIRVMPIVGKDNKFILRLLEFELSLIK